MKNVTITLDEKTAVWVRVHAARHKTSVSRIVGDMLRDHMRGRTEYEQAMRRFLSRRPVRFKPLGGRFATREELHDRHALR
ncbi:MAG: hypothetical protein ACRDGM_10280 [bacterium]